MQIGYHRGALVVSVPAEELPIEKYSVPAKEAERREKRDGSDYHITILCKAELAQIELEQNALLAKAKEDLKIDFQTLGLGQLGAPPIAYSMFLVVCWPCGNKFRVGLGLAKHDFHLTLGFSPVDMHDKPKDVRTLISVDTDGIPAGLDLLSEAGQHQEAIEMVEWLRTRNLLAGTWVSQKILTSYFKLGRYDECLLEIESIGSLDMELVLKKVEVLFRLERYEESLAALWSAVFAEPKSDKQELIAKILGKLQEKLGSVRIDDVAFPGNMEPSEEQLKNRVPAGFNSLVYEQYLAALGKIQDIRKMKLVSPLGVRHFVWRPSMSKPLKLARNFSWLIPHLLAGMSTPRNADDIAALEVLGIRLVITLTEEEPLDPVWFSSRQIKNVFVPVPNYHPPSIEQVDDILYRIAMAPRGVLVHCGGGKGRAGTVLACYMLVFGLGVATELCADCKMDPVAPGCCSDEACAFRQPPFYAGTEVLELLRQIRPESLETELQEEFMRKYCSILWKRYSSPPVERVKLSGESMGVRIDGSHRANPDVLFLVGLPGSGKSSFALQLVEACPDKFIRISQDEIGGKDATESAFSHAAKKGNKCVIVDRCNATCEERKRFIQLAFDPKYVAAVYFDVPKETCLARINRRFDHENIKAGSGGNAVNHFLSKMVPPSKHAEGLSAVYSVSGFEDVKDLIAMFDPKKPSVRSEKETGFNKFPRTTHLVNLGGASRDDLIFTEAEVKAFLKPKPGITLTLEEKIDGANLGFSIDKTTGEIRAQNRSHFVHSKYHPQFEQLSNWIYQHQVDLHAVLEGGNRVLFGEWMYAKHSIHYTKLPDYFVAFDILDVPSGKFLARSRFHSILSSTSIASVPRVPFMKLPESSASIIALLNQTSALTDSTMEGIYFRKDDESTGFLLERAKVVRSDFICGDEHWSKGRLTINRLAS